MAVKARPGETADSLLRRFKKEVIKSEVLRELRDRECFVSPSEQRRRKREAAIKRAQKKQAKIKQY